MVKKRQHYVPRAYLASFCDEDGKVHVCLKDDPDRPIHQSPDNVAFHKYYYSQPLADGSRDHDTLEDFFSNVEAKWPPLVARLRRREDVNDALPDLFDFVSLQRARVPALRDASEKMAAELLKVNLHMLDAMGQLPPKPEARPDILDHVEYAIDPHHSIHAMPTFLRAMELVLARMGFGVLHASTATPFLTSDNPVIYFDPEVPEEDLLPYTLRRDGGSAVLCFPITPTIMLYGHSSMRAPFARHGLRHSDLRNQDAVDMMNRMACRFAYRAVFAREPGCEALVRQFADKSPVVETRVTKKGSESIIWHQSVFGRREPKLKWKA